MKFPLLRSAATLLVGVAIGLSTGCESRPAATTAPAAVTVPADSTQAVVAAAYICPMACEGSASNTPGKCPVCEMTLERNPAYKPQAQ